MSARAAVMIFAIAALCSCRARAPEPDREVFAISDPTDFYVPPDSSNEDDPGPIPEMPPRLVLGLLPIFEPEEMAHSYAPFASYLGEKLHTLVVIELTPDYESMIDLVAAGKIDLVQLAPLAYVSAKEKAPSLELLVTNISEGSSTYSGFILAHAGSDIASVQDLRGKRFAFVDRESASGYLFPYAFFLENGIDPERFFKSVIMTGRHDIAVRALVDGEVDGAATFSGALLNAEAKGVDSEKVAIIAKTARIPYDAWCVRNTLSAPVKRAIVRSMLSLSTRTERGRRILSPLRSINAFVPASDETYNEIRRVKKLVDEATN